MNRFNLSNDNFFSNRFKNIYTNINNMDKNFGNSVFGNNGISPDLGLPNILDFGLDVNTIRPLTQSPSLPKNLNFNHPITKSNTNTNTTPNKYSDMNSKLPQFAEQRKNIKLSEKKCGIKDLVEQSKFARPFSYLKQQEEDTKQNSKKKTEIPVNKIETIQPQGKDEIQHSIRKEVEMEQFIGKETEIPITKNVIPVYKEDVVVVEQKSEPSEPEKENLDTCPIANDKMQYIIDNEILSVSKSFTELDIKKIDNKNHDNNIVDMNSRQIQKMNEIVEEMVSPATNNPEPVVDMCSTQNAPNAQNAPNVPFVPLLVNNSVADNKTPDSKNENSEWTPLTIDLIGISLKVVGDLPINAKLKIVNNCYLAEDNSYIGSISRYSSGQSRDKIISFLDHLFSETERNIWEILGDIRTGKNVNKNISILQGTVSKIHIFVHRYEYMRNVYKTDSGAFARLGIIRDKFHTFLNTLFRDVTLPEKDRNSI
ncbi:MAG: hypothetical protein Satyrvirus16_11 [Satyrvirus sp.]|uniref:Uncharacterized protein n=1 Tax=Satyrvirus sp. TaxID=2487771 RepID=A0A3G5ADY8_9VIRU|nr:MAG: hypothetical protein Satyrvirus16_11 [Satyrvirus sp.]